MFRFKVRLNIFLLIKYKKIKLIFIGFKNIQIKNMSIFIFKNYFFI